MVGELGEGAGKDEALAAGGRRVTKPMRCDETCGHRSFGRATASKWHSRAARLHVIGLLAILSRDPWPAVCKDFVVSPCVCVAGSLCLHM
jgi:hypothetical protein